MKTYKYSHQKICKSEIKESPSKEAQPEPPASPPPPAPPKNNLKKQSQQLHLMLIAS